MCLNKCRDTTDTCNCVSMTSHIKREILAIKNQQSILNPSYPQREKRFVATLVGGLVGVSIGYLLSKFDLLHANDRINKVQENEDHLLMLSKRHMSVLNSTTQLLKNIEQHYDSEVNRCFHHINLINDKLTYNLNGSRDDEIRIGMLEIYNRINILIEKIKESYDDVIEEILDGSKGKLHHSIFNETQLNDNIQEIESHLRFDEMIPSFIHSMELYELMKIRYAMHSNRLIFKIEIPIVSIKSYNLHQLISLKLIYELCNIWIYQKK